MFAFINNIPQKYKRIVSTGEYSKKVDVIRFFAVIFVILCHINAHTRGYGNFKNHNGYLAYCVYNFFQGICLFFVLSGYILANTMFKTINENKKINLKKYYLRRLTRLEPAYLLALTFSFIVMVFVIKKYTLNELTPHYLSSIFYCNNIFYPRSHPVTYAIAWTLELEVQFYIVLPFLIKLYVKNLRISRIICLIIILAIPFCFSTYSWNNDTNIFYHIPYFIAGVLLADILNNEQDFIKKYTFKKLAAYLIATICFLATFCIDWYDSYNNFRPDIFPLIIFILYYLIFTTNIYPKIFLNKWLAFIGGMCYSLYLIHYIIISFFGKITLHLRLTENYWVNYFLQTLLLIPIIIICGGLFYRFIELPTMKKEWYKNILK